MLQDVAQSLLLEDQVLLKAARWGMWSQAVSLFMLMFTLLMQSVQLLTPTLQVFHSALLFLLVGDQAIILLAICPLLYIVLILGLGAL